MKVVEMINIKLNKCGGFTEALTIVAEAKQYDMRIMIGFMLGSLLAIETALPSTTYAEFVDLDDPIWLAQDISLLQRRQLFWFVNFKRNNKFQLLNIIWHLFMIFASISIIVFFLFV